MLDLAEVGRIVQKAASSALGSGLVKAYAEPTTDSLGRDALLVTIVLTNDRGEGVSGDEALETLVRIRDDLLAAGDERFPILEYATEEELGAHGDPEC
jgi:hypothetical protein